MRRLRAVGLGEREGAGNTSELDAAAGSFYVYGQNHGTLSNTPAVGDAVVFDYQGGGVADHVAIVTQVNSDGTIETVSGDWNGDSGSEATVLEHLARRPQLAGVQPPRSGTSPARHGHDHQRATSRPSACVGRALRRVVREPVVPARDDGAHDVPRVRRSPSTSS